MKAFAVHQAVHVRLSDELEILKFVCGGLVLAKNDRYPASETMQMMSSTCVPIGARPKRSCLAELRNFWFQTTLCTRGRNWVMIDDDRGFAINEPESMSPVEVLWAKQFKQVR